MTATDELQERVLKFTMLQLPGQPQSMHMGTAYLVDDLWSEVRRLRKATDSALPTPDSQDIFPLVIQDLLMREQLGIKTYGVSLQSHNGRDALQDAYEEALDLAVYLKQAILERGTP